MQRLDAFDFDVLADGAQDELLALILKIKRDAEATEEETYTLFLPHQLDSYVETCILRCRQMVQQKSGVII
ncbi:hypothetical protein [Exiguobacterium sp. s56]|uniref:hypothetical protein n=1 Tax=Exiguobacterium sp. s56 TaxID=2751232 RepID=UPI001BE5099B|nr:hypothetical protein [Exiguobacterium sp. s56]